MGAGSNAGPHFSMWNPAALRFALRKSAAAAASFFRLLPRGSPGGTPPLPRFAVPESSLSLSLLRADLRRSLGSETPVALISLCAGSCRFSCREVSRRAFAEHRHPGRQSAEHVRQAEILHRSGADTKPALRVGAGRWRRQSCRRSGGHEGVNRAQPCRFGPRRRVDHFDPRP